VNQSGFVESIDSVEVKQELNSSGRMHTRARDLLLRAGAEMERDPPAIDSIHLPHQPIARSPSSMPAAAATAPLGR
jgi:hypothetical protein